MSWSILHKSQLQTHSVKELAQHKRNVFAVLNSIRCESPQVFIAEDSDLDFSLIETILRDCLHPPVFQWATNGEEALALLRSAGLPLLHQRRPDLVILDLNLPRVNGMDVLEFIKSQELIRDIPVVIFTSSQNVEEKNRALELGAEECYTKPLNLDEMIAILTEVCSKYLDAGASLL